MRARGYLREKNIKLHTDTRNDTRLTEYSHEEHITLSKGTPRQNVNKERRVNMFNDEVKPKLELISLFPTPLVKANIGRDFTKKEMECIANIPMYFDDLLQRSQSKDYQLFNTFAEELKDIKTFCEQELKRYLEDIEGVDTDITNLKITASWLNKLKPQNHIDMHNHRNSHLSGVLYIRCLSNDNIQFTIRPYDRFPLELPKKKNTQFNSEVVSVEIKEGDLVIFPSLLLHQVSVNETKDQERMSLSFDTWPTHLPSLFHPFK